MAKRRQVIEIIAPTLGRRHDAQPIQMNRRAQPNGGNSKMYYGANQKEYGTSLYSTATNIGAPVNFIFDAKFPNASDLQVFSHTNMYRYSSSADTFVVDGQTYTGTYEDFWSGVMHNNQFFYTNGENPIQVKTAIGATGTALASSLATNTYKANVLMSFKDHLNLYRTQENGTEYFKRVRWTTKGALTLTGTADFGSGTAGAIDLQDAEGEIKTAVSLSGTIAIFAERSIHIQYWVGGTGVYEFTKTVSGVGTPSRRGALAVEDAVYFIGSNSFYEYHGGSDLRDIGETVKRVAFGEVNKSALDNSFLSYDQEFDEVSFHIPTEGSEKPTVAWVYNRKEQTWSRLDRPYTAKGSSTRVTGTTIGDLAGSIGGLTFTYGDFFLEENAEVLLYADTSGRIVKKDPTTWSLSINGTTTPQAYSYYTPDLVGPEAKGGGADPYDKDDIDYTTTTKRWQQVSLDMTGQGSAIVEYSIDRGASFTAFPESPVTLVASGTAHTLDLDVSSDVLGLRVRNATTNDSIALSYVKVDFIPSGGN